MGETMGRKSPPSLIRSAKARPTPLRQWTVRRSDLLARLARDAADMQTIVIEAPPGYGKSTMMRQWLGNLHRTRTPHGLAVARHAGRRALALCLPADRPVPRTVPGACAAWLWRIAGNRCGGGPAADPRIFSDRPAALFIDDFHVIANGAIHRAIGRLAAMAPEGFQLVLSSRIALPMALVKARLAGHVVGAARGRPRPEHGGGTRSST